MPKFSVVIATYHRGKHIVPTLESVLAQSFEDYEVLVIGDGCTDDTQEVLRPYIGERVRWHNLDTRCGSQSFPNNHGISLARGTYIAYLGHDDIWMPDHLENLSRVFDKASGPDFAVSGCIYHTPPGSNLSYVTGFFDESELAASHFFPPSSLAHKRDAVPKIGNWRAPQDIRPPVDADFQLRAVAAGLRFESTNRVTVHKFAAGHRYLSYLKQSSKEQTQLAERSCAPDFDEHVSRLIEEAKANNTFMRMRTTHYHKFAEGELFRLNAQRKGNAKPELVAFDQTALIRQANDVRALDWHPLKLSDGGYRWSGPNPRPKILVPYCGREGVICSLQVQHEDSLVLNRIVLSVNGQTVDVKLKGLQSTEILARGTLQCTFPLLAHDYTIIEIVQPDDAMKQRGHQHQAGIAVGEIELRKV